VGALVGAQAQAAQQPRIGSIQMHQFQATDYQDPAQYCRDAEQLMTAERWPNDAIMLMAPTRFLSAAGGALAPFHWWNNHKIAFESEHGHPPTWENFKTAFTEYYTPQVRSREREARALLHKGEHAWRPTDNVNSYVHRFQNTILHAQHGMAEVDKIEWFLQGLSPTMKRECVVDHVGREWTRLSDLIEFARGQERRRTILSAYTASGSGSKPSPAAAAATAGSQVNRRKMGARFSQLFNPAKQQRLNDASAADAMAIDAAGHNSDSSAAHLAAADSSFAALTMGGGQGGGGQGSGNRGGGRGAGGGGRGAGGGGRGGAWQQQGRGHGGYPFRGSNRGRDNGGRAGGRGGGGRGGQGQRAPRTAEWRAACREWRLCHRCGDEAHGVADCPFSPMFPQPTALPTGRAPQ
jgi:hypothetical protein